MSRFPICDGFLPIGHEDRLVAAGTPAEVCYVNVTLDARLGLVARGTPLARSPAVPRLWIPARRGLRPELILAEQLTTGGSSRVAKAFLPSATLFRAQAIVAEPSQRAELLEGLRLAGFSLL